MRPRLSPPRTTTLSATPTHPPPSPPATPASAASLSAPPSSTTRTPRCAPPRTRWTGRAARGASRGGTTACCAGWALHRASRRGTRTSRRSPGTSSRVLRSGSGSRTWGGAGTSTRRTRRGTTRCCSSTLSRCSHPSAFQFVSHSNDLRNRMYVIHGYTIVTPLVLSLPTYTTKQKYCSEVH
jgi:hypothetical protein